MFGIEFDVSLLTPQYIASQVCVIFAVALLGATYLVKDKKVILYLCISNAIFYSIQYILLGNFAGVAVNIIGIVRAIWLFLEEKKNIHQRLSTLIIIEILFIISTIVTFSSWQDLLALAPCLIFTYTVWQDDIKVYRLLGPLQSVFWLGFNIYCKSILAIMFEIVLFSFEIIGIIKFYKDANKDKNSKI